MDLTQELTPQMQQKVSPRLVAASYILELSSLELQQAISAELNDNPAMEMMEKETCSVCGGALQGSICPHCLTQQKQDTSSDEAEVDDRFVTPNLAAPADEEFDPLTQVAAQMTLAERLLMELQAMLPPEDMSIAEFLVGNLDDNGYLTCTVAETADLLSVEPERVELVLRLLQSLEPVGIGARSLQECLLIQMDYLAQEGAEHLHVREIVSHHLTSLAEHKYGRIASELGISTEAVANACDFIRQRLNPYPARSYSGPQPGATKADSSFVMPDVIINESEDGFEIEVVESKRFILRVTPLYQDLHRDLERNPTRFSEDERRHIQHYVSRAKLFIANINQRRQTLHKITSYIVEVQKEFLAQGIRYLRALTRAQVAAHLGMHESTVSRATAAKYVMLPSRKVIPFAEFFQQSLSVMDVIKEMITKEAQPMTDQEIAGRLAERGIFIARRTVAKYREQLGILPSSLR